MILDKVLDTGDSKAGFIMRVALSIVMLAHGGQQTIGILGGMGFTDKIEFYNQHFGVPFIFGFLGIVTISIGAIFVLLGWWTRLFAFLILIFLFTAMILGGHLENGILMNWEGTRAGEGFEYHILGMGLALSLVFYGGGWMSIDRVLSKKWRDSGYREDRISNYAAEENKKSETTEY